MGHMISDGDTDELHLFAQCIGLRREWYQEKGALSHYDLTTPRMRKKAANFGAIEINPKKLVRMLRSRKGSTDAHV